MSREKELHQKILALPHNFYRYRLDSNTIVTELVERTNLSGYPVVLCRMVDYAGRVFKTELSRPYDIQFGVYDGHRKCVFFEEPDKEKEAALIFDKHYDEVITKCEDKVKDCILKRKALQRIIKKGGVTDGSSV